MRSSLLSIASVSLVACGAPLKTDSALPADGEVLHLDWQLGQQFHLASTVRHTAVGGGAVGGDLEVGLDASPSSEAWSTEAVWTVQVVEHDTIPDVDDVLYDYAVDAAGRSVPLSVLRAQVDATLTGDADLVELDPVVYLVFRSDNERLAGVVEFTTVDGERRSRALSSHDLNRSSGTLTQAHLAALPTYVAPWGSRWGDGERRLEDGSRAFTERVDDGITDVFFDDTFGGGGVALRYEAGQPWPVWTVTDNAETRLLSEEDLRSWPLARMSRQTTPPEDFDFRAALAAPLDLDAAFHLTEEHLDQGLYTATAYEGFRPWAGYWWPLSEGELVVGHTGAPTFSDRIQDQVDPLAETMETQRKAYEEAETDEERAAAKEAYNTAHTELVELLRSYYDHIQAGLDGGSIRIQGNAIIKDATDDDTAWYYPLDQLSAMDKWAVVEYLRGFEGGNPFYLAAWEYLNSYSPAGESWWGHCNGWAAASILTHEPRETRSVHVGGHLLRFSPADQKGLLSEAHYTIDSRFFGTRYDGEDDDVSDLSPVDFHRVVGFYLDQQGVPFVMDTTATEEVWNFPAWEVSVQLTELEGSVEDGRINLNTATLEQLMTVPGLSEKEALAILDARAAGGAFQSLSELYNIRGVQLDNLGQLFTLESTTRRFAARAVVKITTDAVAPDHVDGVPDLPFSEDKVWEYTLEVDSDGRIVDGEWKDERDHPDFVWVPLVNARGSESNGSENPYMIYGNYLDMLGSDVER